MLAPHQTAPQPVSPIDSLLATLIVKFEELRKEQNELAERLTPVRNITPPSTSAETETDPRPPGVCSIEEKLLSRIDDLRLMIDQTQRVRSELRI